MKEESTIHTEWRCNENTKYPTYGCFISTLEPGCVVV